MKNQKNHFHPSTQIIRDFNAQEIYHLGTQVVQTLEDNSLTSIEVRFLAECFREKKQEYLPKELIDYLRAHPNEYQRVIDCTKETYVGQSLSSLSVGSFSMVALIICCLGLVLLIIYYTTQTPPNSSKQISNKQKKEQVLPDSGSRFPQKKNINRKTRDEKGNNQGSVDTMRANPTIKEPSINQNRQQPSKTYHPPNPFKQYIAARDNFEDPGIMLDYSFNVANRSENNEGVRRAFTVKQPAIVEWRPIKQTITFTLTTATTLPDSLNPIIRLEDNHRKIIKLLSLQRIDQQTWVGNWQATRIGLYHWRFQLSKNKNQRQQPTGKLFIGDKIMIEKLYQKYSDLQGQ